MAGRNTHFSNSQLFFSFLTAGIVLLFLPKSMTSKINSCFDPIFTALSLNRQTAPDTITPRSNAEEDRTADREYKRLQKTYLNLRVKFLELNTEYERLSRLRSGLRQLSPEGLVLAKITRTVSNYNREVVIDKGRIDSVRVGQYVLSGSDDSAAPIGVISSVSETTAKVRLVTDTMQTLEIQICRDGTSQNIPAMMTGNGDGTCRIANLSYQLDIREGDTVYAAAVPEKLPVPMVVGEVTNVRRDDREPLLWKITVRPIEEITALEHVVVVVADRSLLDREE